MKPRPIGILDSGVGGLSVLREIRKKLPHHDLYYVGDSAWCPYGTKTADEIQQRVGFITERLIEDLGVELIVVACNSATIHAIQWLRAKHIQSFVGIEPAVKPACKQTETGVIGVLATESSISGEKFHKLVDNNAPKKDIKVITQTCPKFVDLVEQGLLQGREVELAVTEYIQPLLNENIDVLVLGCTHYPFLRSEIEKQIPASVAIIDTGEPVANQVVQLSGDSNSASNEIAKTYLKTSGDPQTFERMVRILLPDLENYEVGKFIE